MNLEAAIRRFNEKVEEKTEDEFRARCLALANDAIRNTPVRTGRLRANWQSTFDRPAFGQIEATGGAGASAASMQAAQVVASLKVDQAYYLTNNLPYAVPIEEGTAKIRPRRMLARAIQNAASKF